MNENDKHNTISGDHIEWLCEPCKTVHPIQKKGRIVQPCPTCGQLMMPTSFNLREIDRLNARVNELESKDKQSQPVQPVEPVAFLHEHAATQQKCLSFEPLEDCDRPLGWTDKPLVHPPAEMVRELVKSLEYIQYVVCSGLSPDEALKQVRDTLNKAKEHGL